MFNINLLKNMEENTIYDNEYQDNNDTDFKKLWLQKHWIILFVGVILYIIGTFGIAIHKGNFNWIEWLLKTVASISEIVLIGGIVSFFSSYKVIVNAYKQELEKILIDSSYLAKRADADTIWERLSYTTIKTKFPSIARALLTIVKDSYFKSKDNIRCYHNYDNTIKIQWDSEDNKWVKVEERSTFCVFADTNKEITLRLNYNTYIGNKKEDEINAVMFLQHNNQVIKGDMIYDQTTKTVKCEVELKLKGSFQYDIIKIINRRLCLDNDNYIGFTAKYITDGISIKVSHPEDMRLTFTERGTIGNFRENIINENTCEYQYKNLILPNQGYTIFITQK